MKEFTIGKNDAGQRLDRWLAKTLPLLLSLIHILQNHNSFNSDKISYCSILGVAYYLSKESFESVISSISSIVAKGSSIIFDYPDENSYTEKAGERTKKQFMLAGVASEKMLACYSYSDIEQLLSAHEFLIYEHLEPQGITEQYFALYNDCLLYTSQCLPPDSGGCAGEPCRPL